MQRLIILTLGIVVVFAIAWTAWQMFGIAAPPAEPTELPESSEPSLALVNGVLIDGTGAPPVRDAVLLVSAGRIAAVGQRDHVKLPAKTQILDVHGGTILPGIINAHVHNAYSAANLEAWARAGVTTVRDESPQMSASAARSIYAARSDQFASTRYARVVGATPMLTAPGGYGRLGIADVDDARTQVNTFLDLGADLIKISFEDNLPTGNLYPMLPLDRAQAIVAAAHARRVPVSVHVSRPKHVELAVQAGVDDIAHMTMDTPSDDLLARVVAQDIYWVPTLELWHGVGWGAPADRNLGRFVAAGGKVALGTDFAGYTIQFDLGMPIHEMEFMQGAGMTPMQIIVAATRNAAHVCNRADTLGTLEVGKIADVLAVDGDPLADLHALLNVRLVLHDGSIVQ